MWEIGMYPITSKAIYEMIVLRWDSIGLEIDDQIEIGVLKTTREIVLQPELIPKSYWQLR